MSETLPEWLMNKKKTSGMEDVEDNICIHQEHNPPMHLHIPQGKQYRHVCPSCGKQQVIKSMQVSYSGCLKGEQ